MMLQMINPNASATTAIKTTNRVKLLWILSILTFFMSAALDNLTTTIVMVALLRKLVDDKGELKTMPLAQSAHQAAACALDEELQPTALFDDLCDSAILGRVSHVTNDPDRQRNRNDRPRQGDTEINHLLLCKIK